MLDYLFAYVFEPSFAFPSCYGGSYMYGVKKCVEIMFATQAMKNAGVYLSSQHGRCKPNILY